MRQLIGLVALGCWGAVLPPTKYSRPWSSWAKYVRPFRMHNDYYQDVHFEELTVEFLVTPQRQYEGKSIKYTELTSPVICNFVIYTAHGDGGFYALLDQYRQDYARWQPGTCLLNFGRNLDQFKTRNWNAHWGRMIHLYLRQHINIALNELVFRRLIVSDDMGFPWVYYVDGDTYFTNKDLSYLDFLNKIQRALDDGQTMEQTYCRKGCRATGASEPNPKIANCTRLCDLADTAMTSSERLYVDDVAFILGAEGNTDSIWLINSGAFIARPSPLSSLISLIVLEMESSRKPDYHTQDQGHLNLACGLLFDWTYGDVRGQAPYGDETLYSDLTDKGRLWMLRNLNETAAKTEYKEFYDFVFGNETIEGLPNPKKWALATPRWLNAPGCPTYLRLWPNNAALVWHPRDWLIHFNSCSVGGFRSWEFRKLLYLYGGGLESRLSPIRDYKQWYSEAGSQGVRYIQYDASKIDKCATTEKKLAGSKHLESLDDFISYNEYRKVVDAKSASDTESDPA